MVGARLSYKKIQGCTDERGRVQEKAAQARHTENGGEKVFEVLKRACPAGGVLCSGRGFHTKNTGCTDEHGRGAEVQRSIKSNEGAQNCNNCNQTVIKKEPFTC